MELCILLQLTDLHLANYSGGLPLPAGLLELFFPCIPFTWLPEIDRSGPTLLEDGVPCRCHSQWPIHLSIDITRSVSRAAPPHGIEGYGFIRLLVDGVNG